MDPNVELLQLFERTEDAFVLARVDARSFVDDADLDPVRARADRHDDVRVRRRESQRVVDQLLHDPAGDAPVQVRGRQAVDRGDAHALVAGGHIAGDLTDVDALGQPRVDRELEALDELSEVPGPGDEPLEELGLLLRRGLDLGECLGDAEDHRDRRPELMGQPGDELLPSRRTLDERVLRGLELPRTSALAFESFGELLDHVRRHSRRQERPSLGGAADGGQDLVAVGVLQDIARGAGDEHPADDLLVLVPRERDDPKIGEIRLQPPGRLDPVHRRHPDVHQHDVGCERANEAERLHARAGLTDHLEVPGLEQRQERLTEAGVVVDDEHPDRPAVTNRAGKDRRFHERSLGRARVRRHPAGVGFAGHTTPHGG